MDPHPRGWLPPGEGPDPLPAIYLGRRACREGRHAKTKGNSRLCRIFGLSLQSTIPSHLAGSR
jgi:hypothetical protein